MRGQRATGKIQRNNYHHGSCGPSLTDKTSSVSLIFAHGTHRTLVARLQDNSRPKSPKKVETKRKLQQFAVSGWLIINGERVIVKKENFKAEIIFNMMCRTITSLCLHESLFS